MPNYFSVGTKKPAEAGWDISRISLGYFLPPIDG